MFWDFVANIQNDMRPNLKILIFCMYHLLILLCLLCVFSSRFRGTDVHLECKSWPKTVKLTDVLWYRCVNETDQHVIFFFSGPDPPWLFLLPQLLHIWHFCHYVQGHKKTAAHKCWCLYLSLYDWRWFLLLYTINEFGPEHYCHCFMGLSRRYVYLLSVILFYFLWPSCHTHQH